MTLPSAQTDQHNDHKYVPHDVQAIKGKEAKEMTTYQNDRLITKEQVVEIAKHVAKKVTHQHEQTDKPVQLSGKYSWEKPIFPDDCVISSCKNQPIKGMAICAMHLKEGMDVLTPLLDKARHEGIMAERERIMDWAINNGITHKKSFVALRNFLQEWREGKHE